MNPKSLPGSNLKLTPEEFGKLLQIMKPYLVALEERCREIDYGEIEVKITVRAGEVERMAFYEAKTWLRDKAKSNP